jgi:hypothetical protein
MHETALVVSCSPRLPFMLGEPGVTQDLEIIEEKELPLH